MTTEADHPIAYARGVLQVQADNYRHQCDQALATLEYLVAALDGGHQWEIDHAIHGATLTLTNLKEQS